MERSSEINEISKAIAASQRQMLPAKKNKSNPHFRSSYADFGAVIQAIEPIWDNGLSFVQAPSVDPESGLVSVETILMHESGQWISAVTSCRPGRNGNDFSAQAIGSAITYLKRYSLQSLLGIPSADDDGEQAMGRGRAPQVRSSNSRPKKSAPPASEFNEKGHHKSWTEHEQRRFCAQVREIANRGYGDVKGWCISLGRPKPSAMTQEKRDALVNHLRTESGREALEEFVASRDFASSEVANA